MPQKAPPLPFSVSILGTGAYLPAQVVTNADLEKRVDTTDEWIVSRTGIRERRVARADEFTSDMAVAAAQQAMTAAGITAAQVGLIIVATTTPDTTFPSTACYVQDRIGAKGAAAFDLAAACSGFLYSLTTASQFIQSGMYEYALVIGAEKLSSITDWTDRNTCVLFGDGAGAIVLGRGPAGSGLLAADLGADGGQAEILNLPASGCRIPRGSAAFQEGMQYIKMSGREVFKQAVMAMQESALRTLERAGLKFSEIDWLVPHQANERIIQALADRLEAPADKCLMNLERYGNTSAACIPILLHEATEAGSLVRGQKLLLVAFGGGLTWASIAWKW